MILLIDNYDSFVHNLARYLRLLGHETLVLRNDAIDLPGVRRLSPEAIVLSPGPCTPREAGCSTEIVRRLGDSVPLLGVCLGHQAIGAAYGARIVAAPEPFHGRTSCITHRGNGLFATLPSPLTVARYHSLIVDEATLPSDLRITARTTEGIVMALQHETLPIVGVQFHPESILTEHGYTLLANFLTLAGLPVASDTQLDSEWTPPPSVAAELPNTPVTF